MKRIKFQKARGITIAIAASAMFTGCSADLSDIDQYVKQIKSHHTGNIEPLPQMKPYERFAYDPGNRRDPFLPDQGTLGLAGNSPASPPPDVHRNLEPLEEFPLDSLRMVGTLTTQGQTWALVRDGQGVVHRITLGNHLGKNYGEILAINDADIKIRERVPNGLGGWMMRDTSITLSE